MSSRFTLHLGDSLHVLRTLPENSVDAVVTDPPYGLGEPPDPLEMLRAWMTDGHLDIAGGGFMGKKWDAFVPQPQLWREVFRVLKPGGHMLAFFGTRTYDVGTLAIRLAGFEIRDQIAWTYSQGFPKSLDVAKAIDAADRIGFSRERSLKFTAFMRSTGLTARQINEATESNMASHYLTDKEQPAVATEDMFSKLRPLIAARGVTIPEEIEDLVRWRTTESENLKRRQVLRVETMVDLKSSRPVSIAAQGLESAGKREVAVTAAHTEEAKQWEGWGTALKPALEPICVARKPLIGTVAENVMTHGTGALNIDGCRVPFAGDGDERESKQKNQHGAFGSGAREGAVYGEFNRPRDNYDAPGRWPANLIHDGSDEVLAGFPQAGGGFGKRGGRAGAKVGDYGMGATMETVGYGDTGSAARFFYCAKASTADRDEGLEHLPQRTGGEMTDRSDGSAGLNNPRDGAGRKGGRRNIHPTVKPSDLMRHLCRLVTPPGGVVLDPFMGSGSTGKAAMLEGFRFIGVDMTPEYLEIARGRIEHAAKLTEPAPATTAGKPGEQMDLFASVAA